jgi:hypothetical protein
MVPEIKTRVRSMQVMGFACLALALECAGCSGKDAPTAKPVVTGTLALPPSAQRSIPEPASWSFPDVIESARAISPRNVEDRAFDQAGLAYTPEELNALPVATMSPLQLQRYADIVTHAYPDAVFQQTPASCKDPSLDQINATAVAGIAYVSLHAVDPVVRERAAVCLREVQERRRTLQSVH